MIHNNRPYPTAAGRLSVAFRSRSPRITPAGASGGVRPASWRLPWFCLADRNRALPAPAPKRHPAVGRIRTYIDERYAEPIHLDTLAQIAGLSRYHLLRIYREAEGKTPHDYLQEVRIRRAKDLLDRGSSIVEAALATGFYDQSHFTNTFRKITGTTPRRYRNNRKILQEQP